jgi:hypothetical protein
MTRVFEYGAAAQFDAFHEAAWQMFWGEYLDELSDDEYYDLVECDDSEIKFHAWYLLDFEIDAGETLIDRFLATKAGKLDPRQRAYLERVRRARLRLYEIEDVEPGHGAHLNDLSNATRLFVRERAGSSQLIQWDLVAARVAPGDDGISVFEGGLYLYPQAAKAQILQDLKSGQRRFLKKFPGEEASYSRLQALAFQHLWLDLVVFPPRPTLVTAEGDEVEPSTVVFDLNDEQALTAALRDRGDVDVEGDVVRWIEHADDGVRALGAIRIEGDRLVLETLSKSRADRGRGWLEALAGSAVTFRDATIETVDEAIERARLESAPIEEPTPADATALHEFYEQHYRRWLDTPLPALKHHTPRDAAQSRSLRPRLVGLLKDLENRAERDRRSGAPAPVLDWIWPELRLSRPGAVHDRRLFE